MGYKYKRVFVGDDPLWAHRKFKYVEEHRVVMARKLRRPLLRTEIVHHKDEDESNNKSRNLTLLPWGVHSRLHNTGLPQSLATRRKRSKTMTGRKFSAQHMKNISIAAKAREAAKRKLIQ